ncbi:MAG TPA: CBS domain-containing protein [Alphaproteobacteria bacterium]|nr:CBS domain-containing protein [Alphaproteobacteria bacterium]
MQKRIEPTVIRDIMTPSPVSVRPETSIVELKALFERYDFNAFPVEDDQGVLRGIVSKLDLLRAFRPDKRRLMAGLWALWAERVEEIMSRGIIAVEPDEPVEAAVDLMIESRRRSLPVIERRATGSVVVGMISRGDLLRVLTFVEGTSS